MTANRRIVWNTVATYGRSLYALVCGLFTARWVLMTLGEVDYGLMGVVGCLTGFISFFSGLLSAAASRFYAFSVGEALTAEHPEQAIDDGCRWFNIFVFIHLVVSIVLMIIGYPIGEWAVRHYLAIPPERVEACVWVFRFSCVTCFISMATVPFQSLYTAHQEIAELTIYGFVSTTLNVVFLSYMVSHEADWFVAYAAWMCVLFNLPQIIISIRSVFKYKEARIVPAYFWNWLRLKKILEFAGGRMIVSLAFLLNSSGVTVLVDKMLGPARNAAMTIGNTVSGHSLTLTSALTGALQPAITNAAGEGDLTRMRSLSFAACKFSTIAVLVFAIPLSLEIDKVLMLWLKNPPALVGPLTICLLVAAVCEQLSCGHWIAIFAIGKVTRFSAVESIVWFTVLPLSMICILLKCDVVGVGLAYVISKTFAIAVKLYFGRTIAGLSIRHWLTNVFVPIVLCSAISIAAGFAIINSLPSSFVRVILTTIACEVVLLPSAFCFCLTKAEQESILSKLHLRQLRCVL